MPLFSLVVVAGVIFAFALFMTVLAITAKMSLSATHS